MVAPSSFLKPRVLASVYIIALITMVKLFEADPNSPLKVSLMGFGVFLLFSTFQAVSRALVLGSFYIATVLAAAFIQSYVRFSTIGLMGMFVLTYILFYNLLYKYEAFSLDYFIKFVRCVLIVFGITLILQQICVLIGLNNFPLLNLTGNPLTKLPIWTMEPSHTARIIGCLFLAYIKCIAIRNEEKLQLKDLFNEEHRYVTISYLWMILTMGSGTGFIVSFIISLYFFRLRTVISFLLLLLFAFIIGSLLHLEQFERVLRIIPAVLSGNVNELIKTDGSAAVRIAPFINTIFHTNFLDASSWFGRGTEDVDTMKDWVYQLHNERIGNINQYGLLSFFMSLVFVYGCAIRKFFSIESLLFIICLGFGLQNFYYLWGCLLILTCIGYFQQKDSESNAEKNIYLVI